VYLSHSHNDEVMQRGRGSEQNELSCLCSWSWSWCCLLSGESSAVAVGTRSLRISTFVNIEIEATTSTTRRS